MDRKGSIRETELTRVLNYDKALSDEIQGIVKAVDELYNNAQAEIGWTLPRKCSALNP